MRRAIAATLALAVVALVAGYALAATPAPTTPQEWCRVTDLATGEEVTVPCHRDPTTTTTTIAPTTTITTTTAPPTTTTPSRSAGTWSQVDVGPNREPEFAPTVAPASGGVCFYRNGVFNRCDSTPDPFQMYPPLTLNDGDILQARTSEGLLLDEYLVGDPTTAPPSTTTTVPLVAQFVETFDDNGGLDRFDLWQFHRDRDILGASWKGGGSWTGDHDLGCGSPDTQRALTADWDWSQAERTAQSVYVCRDHLMTSMGESSGYDIVTFSPHAVFNDVTEVSFDVNLTDLGARQWWKVGVLSEAAYNDVRTGPAWAGARQVPRFIFSDVGPSDVFESSMATSDWLVATWSGGASAGYPGGMKIGDTKVGGTNPTPGDKATRHPVVLRDNGNGTVTFSVAGAAYTSAGSFPACPCRVVFYDHNYTPDKDGPPQGHTWHWDNIVVR